MRKEITVTFNIPEMDELKSYMEAVQKQIDALFAMMDNLNCMRLSLEAKINQLPEATDN